MEGVQLAKCQKGSNIYLYYIYTVVLSDSWALCNSIHTTYLLCCELVLVLLVWGSSFRFSSILVETERS